MAEYDGSIRIGTGIDEKGFKAGSKELESAARNLAKSVSDSLGEGAKIALQKQTDAFIKLNQQYAAQEQKIKDLGTRLHELQRTQVETPIFKETSKDLSATEKRLDNLYGTLRKLEHEGRTDTRPYKDAIVQIDIHKQKVQELQNQLKELKQSGEAYQPADTSKVRKEIAAAEQKQMQMYTALQTSAESLTQKIGERVEKEEAVRKKIAEEAAEEERLEQIRENATVSDQKTVDLVERQKQLQEEISDLKKAGVTEGYQDYEDRIAELEKIKQELNGEAAEEQRLEQIRVNSAVSNQQIIDLLEQRKQLTAEIKDLEAAGVGLGYKQYEDANKELEEINGKIKDYQKSLESVPEKFEKMRKSAQKSFSAVSNGTKKSSSLLSTFSSRFKGLALSLLIFNQISKAFNAMVAGMKKGFENLSGYSNSYASSIQSMKNAMSTLGNQFAAAFAPIVQAVIPWLNSLIGVLTTAMTYVSQFMAVLGGKSTFTKAKKVQDSYNKSLGGTAAAADKARGALAKFDDLDVLEKKDETSGGGGGGGVEDTGADMFEEVPVDTEVLSFWQRVQEAIKPVIDYAQQLKDIFSRGFFDGLGDWEYRWESIKSSISSIKESLMNIFTDPAVLASADSWAQSVAYMLGSVTGSVASIGLTIATNLIGGIETYLEQNKERIKGHLVEMFDIGADINETLSGLFTSISYVFEAFSGETAQQLTANLIGMFVNAFMGVQEIVLKLSRDILNTIISPFVDNKEEFRTALEGFLGILEEVTGTIKETIDHTFDKLNEVYDEHFKPFFDAVAEGLSEITESFLKFWNENVQPILDKLAKKFDEVMSQHIQPMIDKAIELLGGFMDLLTVLWETVMVPLVQWIIDNILPVILPIFQGLYEGILEIVGYISDIISGLIQTFQGIIDFLIGVFTGDWDRAWNGVSNIITGWMNTIKAFIDTVMATIKTIFVTVLNIISATWTSIFTAIGAFVNTITTAIVNTITGFMSSAKEGISKVLGDIKNTWDTIWTGMKDNVSNIFSEMWSAIKSAINNILGGVEKMANGVVSAINKIIEAINGLEIENPFTGEEIWSPNIKPIPPVSIPRLATGAVIRGGNPFMAILGDQPAGRTNIEAPLDTIKQAVREELSSININSSERVPVTINLNYDGETFARLSISDILSELDRKGYDISVLGAT